MIRSPARTLAAATWFLLPWFCADAEPLTQPLAATRVVDLTHEMHEAMPYWPGGLPFRKTRLVDYPQGYLHHKFEMAENNGTHVDAPSHFAPGNRSIDDLSLAELIVPAVVIDVREAVDADPGFALGADDVRAWEQAHGTVPAGSLVILNTGWHQRFDEPARYVNRHGDTLRFPGFGTGAAALLVERNVAGLGIDTLSIDPGPATGFPAHHVVLRAGIYMIENLANLDELPTTGATVIVGVLPVRDGSQAQARVLALLP